MKKLLLTLLACGIVLIAGCGKGDQPSIQPDTRSAVTGTDLTHVITADTVYYMTGPQQARPPEGTFKAGTKVAIIQDAGSYSAVRSADGVQAYVSTASLRALEK